MMTVNPSNHFLAPSSSGIHNLLFLMRFYLFFIKAAGILSYLSEDDTTLKVSYLLLDVCLCIFLYLSI
jgi:hypothetical protein